MAFNPIAAAVIAGIVALQFVRAWTKPHRRARRLLARAPRGHLVETRDGDRIVVEGTITRALQPLVSPLTHRPCVAYLFMVGRSVAQEAAEVPFILSADGTDAVVTGAIYFGGEPSEVANGLCPGLDAVLKKEGSLHLGLPGMEEGLNCREAVLREGDVVSVLGRVSLEIDPAGQRETPRGQPLRRIIKGDSYDPVIVSKAR